MPRQINKSNIFSASIIFALVMGKLVGFGGVDLDNYQQIIYTSPREWGVYYLSNFASWSIIYTAFKLTDAYPIGFALALNDLMVWGIFFLFTKRDERFNIYLAPLALFSAVGILLSYNVLRQYIAVIFLLIASIRFFQNRGAWVWPFILLALFSHFSSAVFIAAMFLSRYNFKKKIFRIALFPVAWVTGVALLDVFPVSKFASASDLGDSAVELYAFLFFACAVFGLFHIKLKLCVAGFQQPKGIREASKFIFYSIAIISILATASPPIWLLNRFIISFIFLTSSFVFIIVPATITKSGQFFQRAANFITLCILMATVLFHQGAIAMIGFS